MTHRSGGVVVRRDSVPVLLPENDAQIHERVRICIAEYFIVSAEFPGKTRLVEQLGADSLELLEIVHILNETFDIDIKPDQLSRMLTVDGACRLVSELFFAAPQRNVAA